MTQGSFLLQSTGFCGKISSIALVLYWYCIAILGPWYCIGIVLLEKKQYCSSLQRICCRGGHDSHDGHVAHEVHDDLDGQDGHDRHDEQDGVD